MPGAPTGPAPTGSAPAGAPQSGVTPEAAGASGTAGATGWNRARSAAPVGPPPPLPPALPTGPAGPRVVRFPRATPADLERASRQRAQRARAAAGAGAAPGAPSGEAGGGLWVNTGQGRLTLFCAGIVLLLLPNPNLRVLGGLLLVWVVGAFLFQRPARVRSWGASASGSAADRRAAFAAGIDGEEIVLAALAGGLPGGPGGYVILQNLALPTAGGDIDHVVVGPTGVFVLETKHLAGLIRYGPAGWQRTKVGRRGQAYDVHMDDPLAQVRRNTRALRQYLERLDSGLCARTRLWITEMIVFSHPEAQLTLLQPGAPAYTTGTVVPAILGHRPALPLAAPDVERIVQGLVSGAGRPPNPNPAPAAERGSALLETALVLPILLTLGLGVVGVGRLTQARMGVSAVAREAARSAALAPSGASATGQGLERAYAVAAGYNLNRAALQVRVYSDGFARGATVSAVVTYDVVLNDIPFLRWTNLRLTDTHAERVDLYRSYR